MAEGGAKAGSSSNHPYLFFSLATLLLAGVTFYALEGTTDYLSRPINALIAINVAVFILCAYDKSIADGSATRVPETLFWTIALVGGSPGLFLGINYFGHKSKKETFLIVLVLILVAQLALVRMYGPEIKDFLLDRPGL